MIKNKQFEIYMGSMSNPDRLRIYEINGKLTIETSDGRHLHQFVLSERLAKEVKLIVNEIVP